MNKTKKSNKAFWIFVITSLIVILIPFCFKDKLIYRNLQLKGDISCLSYDDLVALTKRLIPNTPLYFKLQKQLNTPCVFNKTFLTMFSGRDKSCPYNYLRIAQWNIERGFNVNAIKTILSNKYGYYYSYKNNLGVNVQSDFKKELEDFSKSDIISLNEVDIGMPRTGYKNVVGEIADSLNYNYVFATEFIELNPIIYHQKINPARYLGLHGNAILSCYPIKSARILRLPECYRWYKDEIQKKSPLESVRRVGAKVIFSEEITKSEVRLGGRNALIANIELPNKEIITVVSTHLEDRCFPDRRFKQFEYLLSNLKSVRRPIVFTGDFNTTTTDSTPTSLKKEIVKRVRDPNFIARQLAFAVIPRVPVASSFAATVLSKIFQYKDPATLNIPVFFPNQERKFFSYLKGFRFSDGEVFDISGNRSSNGRRGLLANSNERQLKGFESTFKFTEPRLIAYFKLDWFFVKPKGNRFKPFNGQTLQLINHAYPGRVSDHEPIIVDLNL